MFDNLKRKLQREIDMKASILKDIDGVEDFIERDISNTFTVGNYTSEEYLLRLATAAMKFKKVTGHDLFDVTFDGLEHWRKQEKGTYTPVIYPAEYVDAREDEA